MLNGVATVPLVGLSISNNVWSSLQRGETLVQFPGSGRSAGKGIGYPLQYSWSSLVAQLVKKLPAMQETWVWENLLEKGTAIHSSILAWKIPWTVYSMGSQRVRHDFHPYMSDMSDFHPYNGKIHKLRLSPCKSAAGSAEPRWVFYENSLFPHHHGFISSAYALEFRESMLHTCPETLIGAL